MRPAVFVDRDGTINHDSGYIHDPKDLVLYDDTVALLKSYVSKGYLIIVLTNQSGINRGYFTEEECNKFNSAVKAELEKHGIGIDAFYICPHTPSEGCNCRKPNTGMAEKAIKEFDIDTKKSIVIGDRDDMDGELARRLGINYLILER